jgi:serine/threonine-protein kinase
MSEDLEDLAPRSLRGVSSPSEKLLGQDLDGRYVLVREVGRGGLSTVFHVEHRYSGRTYALKLLNPEFRDHPEARMRMMTEARMLGAVRHPHVVEIIDAGIVRDGRLSGMPFLVMERLPAKSLDALITARGKLSLRDTIAILKFAAAALGAVHQANIVHRDVKPGNLLVVRKDRGSKGLKLIDFGAATFASRPDGEGPASTLVGTPLYMAPEHIAGQRVTPAADVYALGISLYECLTGETPFRGSFEQVYAQAATAPRPDVRKVRPDTPDPLAALIRRCLSVDPEARPRDGNALLAALEDVQVQITSGVAAGGEEATSRRSQIRVPYAAPVEIRVPTGAVLDGTIQDISMGGIFILAAGKVPPEGRLDLRFALPGGPIVSVGGTTRWARGGASGETTAIGVSLDPLPAADQELIESYVKLAEI